MFAIIENKGLACVASLFPKFAMVAASEGAVFYEFGAQHGPSWLGEELPAIRVFQDTRGVALYPGTFRGFFDSSEKEHARDTSKGFTLTVQQTAEVWCLAIHFGELTLATELAGFDPTFTGAPEELTPTDWKRVLGDVL